MKSNAFKQFVMVIISALYLSGCALVPKVVTKGTEFPQMYIERPKSLLIMPPMNMSTAADAKEYYPTTIEMPIAFHGYYTFPYEMTAEILKQEGVYDSELVYDLPLNKFREYFGADAVLFTKIKMWDTSYFVAVANLTISIDAEIKSTKTSQSLWKYNGTVDVDLTGEYGGGGPLGVIIAAVATTINTASADYVDYAKQANSLYVRSIPYGPYHPYYLRDKQVSILQQQAE